jgi:HK97 family phage prohead protease
VPWGVGKRDSCPASKPWAVYLIGTGKVAGCHRTEERALAHQRALYANEPAASRQSRSVMHEYLTVPVEWKTTAGSGTGELEGYASVFGNVDQDGDVVLPGAFRKTLADWSRSRQPLPLIADHDLTTGGVIGSVKQAREDGIGLRIRAGFSSDPKAQSIRTKMIEGHLKGMSFTYQAVKHYMGQMAGKSARFLQEVKLFEATVTPFPMNTLAVASAKADTKKPYGDVPYADPGYLDADGNQVSKSGKPGVKRYPLSPDKVMAAWSYINQAKNAGQYTAEQLSAIKGRIRSAMKQHGHQVSEAASLDFAAFAESMRSALAIPVEAASKAAADLLVAAYHPRDETAAGPDDDPDPTADAAAGDGTADSTPDDAAAYALGIITPPGPPDGAPGGEPPQALAGPLAQLDMDRAAEDMDRLEAELQSARGGTA